MLEINKSIKKILQNEVKNYKEGNKKALSVILNLIKKDIAKLINENELTIKLTKTIIEDTLDIEIKDDTFYKWVRRNIKNNPISINTQKSNFKEKEEKVSNKVSVPKEKKENKSIKEVKNVKNKLDLKKDINTKKSPTDILNDDINITNDEYKDLL